MLPALLKQAIALSKQAKPRRAREEAEGHLHDSLGSVNGHKQDSEGCCRC